MRTAGRPKTWRTSALDWRVRVNRGEVGNHRDDGRSFGARRLEERAPGGHVVEQPLGDHGRALRVLCCAHLGLHAPSTLIRVPTPSPAAVVSENEDTLATDGGASPLNPNVVTDSRSDTELILDVAWRSTVASRLWRSCPHRRLAPGCERYRLLPAPPPRGMLRRQASSR